MPRLTPVTDTSPADWIVAELTTFGESVLSLVPSRFSAYLRVFHPARRFIGDAEVPVRWSEIAAACGMSVSAGMQLFALTRGMRFAHDSYTGVYDYGPLEGSIPEELVRPLAERLARHTTTPEHCWFAIWHGFGGARADLQPAPTFHLPARDYHLLVGAVDAVTESALEPGLGYQSASLWWPEDRAWCVATEIDLNTTYVACTDACREDLLAAPELETLAIDPGTPIDIFGDPLNPAHEEWL